MKSGILMLLTMLLSFATLGETYTMHTPGQAAPTVVHVNKSGNAVVHVPGQAAPTLWNKTRSGYVVHTPGQVAPTVVTRAPIKRTPAVRPAPKAKPKQKARK